MRNTIAIYLLLLYVSAALLRPVMPVLMDGVAHVLFYKQHMETVHTHNGKAHVHAEIATVMADDAADQSDVKHTGSAPVKSFKITDFLFAHLIHSTASATALVVDAQWAATAFSYHFRLGTAVYDVPVPPPNVATIATQLFQDSQYALTYRADALYRSKGVCTSFFANDVLETVSAARGIAIFFLISSPHFLTVTV